MAQTQAPEFSPTLEKIKKVVGLILVAVGIAVFLGSAGALCGHLLGYFVVPLESIHTFFMTGVISSLGGFHLLKNGNAEISFSNLALQL